MDGIDRIVVTGDFLRLNERGVPSQEVNIRWLYNLIKPALGLVVDLPLDRLVFDDEPSSLSSRMYAINGLERTMESWVKLFKKEPSSRELAIIYDQLGSSLVIAFEMPEILHGALDVLEIPYLDFTIHPVRFLDDLVFGVRGNLRGIDQALLPWAVCEEEFHVGAGLAMASVGRLNRLKCFDGFDEIALFAGQTTDDKVLIKNGKLLEPEIFLDAFAEISSSHPKVLVKPHPFGKANKIVMMLTRLFPNTQVVDDNFYHLLSHDNLSTVYSLTSSTSIEAAYFGKRGVHLSDYPYQFTEDTAQGGAYFSIRPEIYMPQFWESVLGNLAAPRKTYKPIKIPVQRNRMRDCLRSYWGADVLGIR